MAACQFIDSNRPGASSRVVENVVKENVKKKLPSKKNGLEESAHAAFSGKGNCTSGEPYKQHLRLSSPQVVRGAETRPTPGVADHRGPQGRVGPACQNPGLTFDGETPWDFWPASGF
jgi:hypothetical protein